MEKAVKVQGAPYMVTVPRSSQGWVEVSQTMHAGLELRLQGDLSKAAPRSVLLSEAALRKLTQAIEALQNPEAQFTEYGNGTTVVELHRCSQAVEAVVAVVGESPGFSTGQGHTIQRYQVPAAALERLEKALTGLGVEVAHYEIDDGEIR